MPGVVSKQSWQHRCLKCRFGKLVLYSLCDINCINSNWFDYAIFFHKSTKFATADVTCVLLMGPFLFEVRRHDVLHVTSYRGDSEVTRHGYPAMWSNITASPCREISLDF